MQSHSEFYYSDGFKAFVFSLFFAGIVAWALSEQIAPHHYGPIGAASGVVFFFLRLHCVRRYREVVAEKRQQQRGEEEAEPSDDEILEPIVAVKGGGSAQHVEVV